MILVEIQGGKDQHIVKLKIRKQSQDELIPINRMPL